MGSDLRVNIELGVTFQYENTFVKPLLTIQNLDPSQDVEEQIRISLEAANVGFARINDQLDISLSEIISREDNPGFMQRVEALENATKAIKNAVGQMATIIKDSGLAERVRNAKKESGS